MTTCLVICHECGRQMYGKDPSRIEYRMVVIGGRIRPICDPCYEDRRSR